MARFKFTKDCDVPVINAKGSTTIMAYKAGTEQTIPQAHVDIALERKAGHVVEHKNKNDLNRDGA